MAGRTSTFTDELAAEICEEIAEGAVLSAVCAKDGRPSMRTVLRWLDRYDGFAKLYDRAREIRADVWGDEIILISDDRSDDYVDKIRGDGSVDRVLDAEHVQRSKLRVDARKWLMAKAAPRRYGERLDLNHSGGIKLDSDPDLSDLADDELAVMRLLLVKAEEARRARLAEEAGEAD